MSLRERLPGRIGGEPRPARIAIGQVLIGPYVDDLIQRTDLRHIEANEIAEIFKLKRECFAFISCEVLLHPAMSDGVGAVVDDHVEVHL